MKKFFTQAIIALATATTCFGAYAQTTGDNNKMYLIKDDRIVGKYDVDAVDYVSFKLPEGIIDEPIWVEADEVGKNKITYTVNTQSDRTAYAHGIVSYYDVNYVALNSYGEYFENLEEADKIAALKEYLPYVGYLGINTDTYTMVNNASDNVGGKFSVRSGTKYYICAWEVDPNADYAPLESFAYTEVSTLAGETSPATLNVNFKRQNSEGLAYEFSGSDNILYVVTVYGMKSVMDSYIDTFGLDFTMGTFGYSYTIDELQGMNPENPEVENATWPAFESGEYILYVRAYDANGDYVDKSVVASAEVEAPAGPEIIIGPRSKDNGSVSINFEISPSNVTEAYVRLLPENDCDDRLNDGYEYYEIASANGSIDIVDSINTLGEYTFTANNLTEQWYAILIYAKDKNGGKTVQRINFFPDAISEWSDYDPVYKASRKAVMAHILSKSHKPTIAKVK